MTADTFPEGYERNPTLSVVVPAHQAKTTIHSCLEGLVSAGFAKEEILVVDDGSYDETGEIAREFGVRVLRHETAQRPAKARNAGAAAVSGDIIVFVDADVVLRQGARQRILDLLAGPQEVTAVFGSYDDRPVRAGAVSFYRNFLHHFVHQKSRRDASTFWTGIGAVNRNVLAELGGFDPEWEAIEDVEFGVRISKSGGHIVLDKGLQGKHLKVWSIWSMFKTDLVGRAIPWSRLILFRGGPNDDLNMTIKHRLSLATVASMGISLVLLPFNLFFGLFFLIACLVFGYLNLDLLVQIQRRGGVRLAAISLVCHVLHYLAGGLGFSWVLLTEFVPRKLMPRQS